MPSLFSTRIVHVMVMVVSATMPLKEEGVIDLEAWLDRLAPHYPEEAIFKIRAACVLIQHESEVTVLPIDISLLHFSLSLANLLIQLDLDVDTIIAAILYPALQYTELTVEDVSEHFSKTVLKLLKGTLEMDSVDSWHGRKSRGKYLDNYRRMLLAMVDDIRVVLIKLVERTVYIRYIHLLDDEIKHDMARHIMDIYAPLANRLGILEIKWELEDAAFRTLQPVAYKKIAHQLGETRIERETFLEAFKSTIKNLIATSGIKAEVAGRIKHIYSIHKKIQRKSFSFDDVYDITAIRILVDTVDQCYNSLSIINEHYEHLPEAFDDYIATPKSNGYQSIHTVVLSGAKNKKVEVQIRTHDMHEKNERGMAAHWMYKEGAYELSYQRKIAWLRQLLDWQRELAGTSEVPPEIAQGIQEDRIYVFTPMGEVISLPKGATPLDFAYHVHTSIGHRCRGAKVDGKLVPLTYTLEMGNRIEILTGKNQQPSRDWMSRHSGYLITPRARRKVHAWFKQQEEEKIIPEEKVVPVRELKPIPLSVPRKIKTDIIVAGMGDMLTHLAYCCKPIPGEPIKGYTTIGRGVTIHREQCVAFLRDIEEHPERMIDAEWGNVATQNYIVDLIIEAEQRSDLLRDLTRELNDLGINVIGLNSHRHMHGNVLVVAVTVEIKGKEQFALLNNKLMQIKGIYSVRRQ